MMTVKVGSLDVVFLNPDHPGWAKFAPNPDEKSGKTTREAEKSLGDSPKIHAKADK